MVDESRHDGAGEGRQDPHFEEVDERETMAEALLPEPAEAVSVKRTETDQLSARTHVSVKSTHSSLPLRFLFFTILALIFLSSSVYPTFSASTLLTTLADNADPRDPSTILLARAQ